MKAVCCIYFLMCLFPPLELWSYILSKVTSSIVTHRFPLGIYYVNNTRCAHCLIDTGIISILDLYQGCQTLFFSFCHWKFCWNVDSIILHSNCVAWFTQRLEECFWWPSFSAFPSSPYPFFSVIHQPVEMKSYQEPHWSQM